MAFQEILREPQDAASPLPRGAIDPIKQRLLFHVVYGQFAGEVGFPPGSLVAANKRMCILSTHFCMSVFRIIRQQKWLKEITSASAFCVPLLERAKLACLTLCLAPLPSAQNPDETAKQHGNVVKKKKKPRYHRMRWFLFTHTKNSSTHLNP